MEGVSLKKNNCSNSHSSEFQSLQYPSKQQDLSHPPNAQSFQLAFYLLSGQSTEENQAQMETRQTETQHKQTNKKHKEQLRRNSGFSGNTINITKPIREDIFIQEKEIKQQILKSENKYRLPGRYIYIN